MKVLVRSLLGRMLFALVIVVVPSLAAGQATITGVVRDTSGAVLPGVTVEAASPALIEKVRSVVSDGNGQYRVIDLRPGTYSVTFTLPGFSTVKRDGVLLEGASTVTVNGEMRVGAIEETITVTGETPLVDVQGVTQQRVLSTSEVLDALPTNRTLLGIAAMVPGVTPSRVVGNMGFQARDTVAVHGGRGGESRNQIGGMTVAAFAVGSGAFIPNISATQETVVDTAALSPEEAGGGVRINLIPREGGNTFSGTIFANASGPSLQGSNMTDELRAAGLRDPNSIKRLYDINGGLGGPILRNRVWFFVASRYTGTAEYVAGGYHNLNRGNPNSWTYAPDLGRQSHSFADYFSNQVRVTYQASQRNKFAFYHDQQGRRLNDLVTTTAPESDFGNRFSPISVTGATWQSPRTPRLLLDAGFQGQQEDWRMLMPAPDSDVYNLVGVLEQSTGITYRNRTGQGTRMDQTQYFARFAASYVTGAHQFKLGITNRWGTRLSRPNDVPFAMSFRFNNGIPNQLTQRAIANTEVTNYLVSDHAIFAQDRWTIRRLTLTYGFRFEGALTSTGSGFAGPTLYAPNRNFTFEKAPWGNTRDITPRVNVAYDLFGTGRTAVKGSLNKYIQTAQYSGFDPITALSTTVNRAWNDANRNFVPDCNLIVLTANGECGQVNNLNFGSQVPVTAIDPDTYRGWGKREYNWEFSAGVQQALGPRVSANVAYFRRWYGNFLATDNRAVGPADYGTFSIAAPTDPRLPGGGGNTVNGYVDINPSALGRVDNVVTFAKNFGRQQENWQGVDAYIDMRLPGSIQLQGGLSTGRTLTDNCEVVAALPEWQGLVARDHCRVITPYLSQVKLFGSYTIPRVNLLVSGNFQSTQGPQILANFVATNAMIAPSLGRPLAQAATTTINIVEPGAVYGDRTNQLDFRLGKTFRFGGRRALVALDLYNALNAHPITAYQNAYASWQAPQAILGARYAKFTAQFDF